MFFQPRFRGSYGLTFGFALGFILDGGVGDGGETGSSMASIIWTMADT